MRMLRNDSIAKGPGKLFFSLAFAALSLLPQLLHGFCDKAISVESAARLLLLKCTQSCGERKIFRTCQPFH